MDVYNSWILLEHICFAAQMFDEIPHNMLKSTDGVCVCYFCGQTESGSLLFQI